MTMARFLVVLGLLIAAGAIFVIATDDSPMPTTDPVGEEQSRMQTYSSDEYGISFSYPDSYTLTEIDVPGSALREQHSIVLQRTEDLPAPEGGEGPPSITIDIYQNDLDSQTTEGWIRNTSQSNFKLGDMTLRETTIDGKDALSYRWDGLYSGTTVAIARPSWVYAFNVMYLEMGDPLVRDFVSIRDSVRLR